MHKVLLALLLVALLGAIDGSAAWFNRAVRAQLAGIIVGSTIKGLIAGVAAAIIARKVNSVPLGVLFGLAVGFALAFIVAYATWLLPRDHPSRKHRGNDRGICHAELWHDASDCALVPVGFRTCCP